MPRKILLLLASSALIVALVAAISILNTQPGKAAANSETNWRVTQPKIQPDPAEASPPVAAPTDSCDIPVKIKGVKVTPVAGLVGNSNVSVEWELGELPRCFTIDSFNVIANMGSGFRRELTFSGNTRTGVLRVHGKDNGGDCTVTITARGHATVTGTNQVKGRFWAR